MIYSSNFTLSSMFPFQNAWPIKRKAVYNVYFSTFPYIHLFPCGMWKSDWITTCTFFKSTSLILVNLRLLQAVRSVGSSGKFYQLPPDKKNTVNMQEFFHQTMYLTVNWIGKSRFLVNSWKTWNIKKSILNQNLLIKIHSTKKDPFNSSFAKSVFGFCVWLVILI